MFDAANIGQNCATRKYFGEKIALSAKFLRFTARARLRAWARVYILKECAALLFGWQGRAGGGRGGSGRGIILLTLAKCSERAVAGAEAAAGLGFYLVEVAALQWV